MKPKYVLETSIREVYWKFVEKFIDENSKIAFKTTQIERKTPMEITEIFSNEVTVKTNRGSEYTIALSNRYPTEIATIAVRRTDNNHYDWKGEIRRLEVY